VTCVFYEVLILKTKRRSTGKMLTTKTFCGVCLYIHQAPYDGKKSDKFKFTATFVFRVHYICTILLAGSFRYNKWQLIEI